MRRATAAAWLLVGYTLTAPPPTPTTGAPVPLDAGRRGATNVVASMGEPNELPARRVLTARASRGGPRKPPIPAPRVDPLLVPFGPLTERHLVALRGCENGGSYTSDPGDRYRGAYQAYPPTWVRLWRRLRRPTYARLDPAAASRAVQDAFARWLHRIAGRDQWPVCSRVAGLP